MVSPHVPAVSSKRQNTVVRLGMATGGGDPTSLARGDNSVRPLLSKFAWGAGDFSGTVEQLCDHEIESVPKTANPNSIGFDGAPRKGSHSRWIRGAR